MSIDKSDGAVGNQIRLEPDVEPGGTGPGSLGARNHRQRQQGRGRRPRQRPATPRRQQATSRDRQRRACQDRRLGHEADAESAEKSQCDQGNEDTQRSQRPRLSQENRPQQRGGQTKQQEEERPIERPARRPIFLQGPQPGHPDVVGNVGETTSSRGRGKHQRHKREPNQQRAPAVGALPIQPRAGGVEQENRGRQKEARVGVGPEESERNQQPQEARPSRLRAFQGQEQQGQSEEGHQVGTFDEARFSRPRRQRQRQGRQRRVRSPPHSHTKKYGPCAQHEAGLEQHRARDPSRTMIWKSQARLMSGAAG